MSTIVNDRDVLLQGAATRIGAVTSGLIATLTNEASVVPADAAGNVSSYAGASGDFKIFANATDVSSLFTLSTVSNPQALTIGYAGRTYTVTAGFDAAEDIASVTIRATGSGLYAGVALDKVFSLGKARTGLSGSPGTNGANGANGARGSLAMAATGTVWSDATADAAVVSTTGSATKIFGDSVTISGSGFAQTKRWNGSGWVDPGQVIAGNMFVDGTLSTNKLVANAASVASTGDTTQETLTFGNVVPGSLRQTNGISLTSTGAPVKFVASVLVSGRLWNTNVKTISITANLFVDGTAVYFPVSADAAAFLKSGALLGQAQDFIEFQTTVAVDFRFAGPTVLAAGAHTFKVEVQCDAWTAGPSVGGTTWGAPPAGFTNQFSIRVGSFAEENKV